MVDNTSSYIDLSDLECQDGPEALEIRKNLLEDFATPAGRLARESVTHSREHMQVYLRIRPFTNKELDQGESQHCMEQQPPSSLLMRAPKDSFTYKSSQRGFSSMTHKFTFSRIFGQDTCQKEFFDETMLGTVKDFIDGQNCLVFTYGVTNAGKTYTIQGLPQDGGILPRSLDVIFNSLEGRLFPSIILKPQFFCDVAKLDERQRKKEEFIKESVLAMADGQTAKLEGGRDSSSMDDVDDSRSSNYTTATEDSQSEISTQSISEDVTLPNVLDDISNRVPDDTSVDVEAQGPLKFSVWVSFAEIYNEYIYDLLEAIPKGKKIRRQALKLSEDKNGQIYIKGLKQICVQTADEAYKILQIGQQNLSMAATKLNQCSSRSHCIFSIKILRVVDVDDPHVARVSQLSFCDLAGSERYTRTQNTGERLKEAGNINTSLLTLGKCIHMLRYNQNHAKSQPRIIPFRESKLTRLFQSFFLGKGKASMIVNVNQCASGFDETIQVLKFSAIAKQVTTVTSKLDHKWKVPADVPKLSSARALSLAVRQSLSRNRMSIPWATPCPQPDGNLQLATVDETYLEEEEEDESSDEEDDDTDKTPKESVLNQVSKTELVQLMETLKAQLIEERKRNVTMEIQIREEVCQEMAQQLVKIEGEFKDQLEKDRVTTEEMFEKRLEMYEKSLKRRHTEDKDEEYEAVLLREDHLKNQVTTLTEQVSVAEKTFKDAKRKYQEKLADAQETQKDHVSKLESELKVLQEKTADLEEILADTQAQFDQTNTRGQQAAVRITVLENELEYLMQELSTEQKAHIETKKLASEQGCTVSELRSQLEMVQRSTLPSEDSSEQIKELQNRLEETLKGLADKEAEASKFQGIAADHQSQLKTLNDRLTEAEDGYSAADEKVQQLSEQCSRLHEDIKQKEQEMIEISADAEKNEAAVNEAQAKISQLKEEISVEEKAHADTTKLASGYATQISLLRSQLETAERITAANGGLAKRNKELENALAEMQRTLTDREVALAEASKWQGSATDLRSQLKVLDDTLKDSERQRSAADEMVQQLSKRCTDLQQTLAQKEQELVGSASLEEKSKSQVEQAFSEIQELKDEQVKEETKVKALEEELKEQTSKTKSKADTIKSLMNKVEMQCLKEQALEKDAKAQKDIMEGLKSALQEQETTMASQDDILAAKEQELESLTEELEALQSKYSDLMKSSSDSMQEVRTANLNHERWNREKENIKKELLDTQVKLCQAEQEREDFKIKLSKAEEALVESNQEVNLLEQNLKEMKLELEDLMKKLEEIQEQAQDGPDKARVTELEKKVVSLEAEITKQVADKEETLSKWRTERDELVKALEKQMTSLLETQKTNEAALAEKDEHIQHLKTKMMENLSDSQTITDDDSDKEEIGKTGLRKGSRRGRGKTTSVDVQLQKEVQQLRKQLEKEKDDRQKFTSESERDLEARAKTISKLQYANQLLQQQMGLIGVAEDKKTTDRNSDSSSSSVKLLEQSPSPQPQPRPSDSPDLFSVEVKDQESFHQPGRRRTRVEMDVTPLQKKQAIRKTRTNTRKARKRKSTELLEEIDIDNFESCADEGRSTRSTRSTRRTTKVAKTETDANDENITGAKSAEAPSSTRSKRAALSKIGDLLHNSPLTKSAKKLVGSPSKSPDVVAHIPPATTEKKRKRRLLKTDISEPFDSSPFEVLKVGETKGDSSHSIVTRKLRSRNTRV